MIQNFATLQHREIFVPILLQGMLEMIHDSLPQTQDVTPSILCLWPTFAFPLGVPWMQTSFLMGKIRFAKSKPN
jgi:DNA-binding transcriptional MocR family regulator